MFPYQLSQVLADQRIRDRVVAAERHALVAEARHGSTDTTGSPTRLRVGITRLLAPFRARRSPAGVRSTVSSERASAPRLTSTSGAGPIGCSA